MARSQTGPRSVAATLIVLRVIGGITLAYVRTSRLAIDDLRVVPKAYPVEKLCELEPMRLVDACAAVRAAVGC